MINRYGDWDLCMNFDPYIPDVLKPEFKEATENVSKSNTGGPKQKALKLAKNILQQRNVVVGKSYDLKWGQKKIHKSNSKYHSDEGEGSC